MAIKRLGATKADRLAAAIGSNLSQVESQLSTPIRREGGTFERVPLDSVRPDPKNPRRLDLTFEELQEGIHALESGTWDPKFKARVIFESIKSKADNFKLVQQLQPILVYRDSGILRIADGERRYWAARLCEWATIGAMVRHTRPAYLRLEQFSANILREGLSLAEHVASLEAVVEEAVENGTPVTSLSDLATITGRPRPTMQRWWALLKAPADVREAVKNGAVNNLETAYLASQEPDAGRRMALLSGQSPQAAASVAPAAARKRGRPKTGVNLGQARDLSVVRVLIEAIPVSMSFAATDWSNAKAVQDAWSKFLKELTTASKSQGAGKRSQEPVR